MYNIPSNTFSTTYVFAQFGQDNFQTWTLFIWRTHQCNSIFAFVFAFMFWKLETLFNEV